MMTPTSSLQRIAGFLAIAAGPLAWASLLVGLSVVDFNFDTFSDPQAILNLGPTAAPRIGWSYWLSMLGSYLCLVPSVLWLGSTLRAGDPLMLRWYTLCGLGYLGLGAAGAAVLAATWPQLMTLYPSASPEQQPMILLAFTTATAIAEAGLQGVLQNLLGSVWLLGLGSLFWGTRRLLGGFTCVLGAMLAVSALGTLLANETLSLLGLSAAILLIPLWSIWLGVTILRSPPPGSV